MDVVSGIYEIKCTSNGKLYVGSSASIYRRWGEHRWMLQNSKHNNQHLQSAWDKYGEVVFEFTVLERVEDTAKLIESEQFWIDVKGSASRKIGFNKSPAAGSCLGIKRSKETLEKISKARKGKKIKPMSDEHREKMRIIATERGKCPEYRAKMARLSASRMHTSETKEKMSRAKRGKRYQRANNSKMNECTVRKVKDLLHEGGMNCAEIGRLFDVHGNTVRDIKKGRAWAWV